MTLQRRFEASLRSLGIDRSAPIGVACSGGADSIALLHLFVEIGYDSVVALHVDHGLREGSSEDAAFVVRTARSLGIGAVVETVKVVVPPRASIEAEARTVRYEALQGMAEAHGLPCVATAHTLDDQAETVLLRSMRGGSLDGIASSRGIFVRPLLDTRREELRGWLTEAGIAWREDPTNADQRFERNWLRHTLLPQLRERRAGVDAVLARLADVSRDDREALDAFAAEVFERARVDDVGVFVDAADLDLLPAAIARRVIRSAVRRVGHEISSDDIERIRSLPSGRVRVGGIDVWRLRAGLAVVHADVPAPDPIELPSRGVVEDRERGLRIRIGAAEEGSWRWRSPLGSGPLRLRARQAGDRVGSRKVSDVLIDAKVPRPLRDLVGIVASDSGALAVVGHAPDGSATAADRVMDVEPIPGSWSREMVWTST